MVLGSQVEVETKILSARVRKTIQSIKEVVGNHSDSDIYVMLKETNMDPNETAQKLLNQDPFHEVKRKKDKKKENTAHMGSAEPRKPIEPVRQWTKSHTFLDRNVRRGGGFVRNALPGISREFRIVRDNRVNQNVNREIKPASLQSVPVVGVSPAAILSDQEHLGLRSSEGQKSSEALNGPSDSISGRGQGKEMFEDVGVKVPSSGSQSRGQKSNTSLPYSASLSSNSSVVGVYSSSSDPVHVPSSDSRSPGVVGAIKREVGVVGVRRLPSENSSKNSSVPGSSHPVTVSGKGISSSPESFQLPTSVTKRDQGQTTATESVLPSISVNRSFLSNQYGSKPHQQLMGHQKAPQSNMEWKPKASQKSSHIRPGIIGTATTSNSPLTDISAESKVEANLLQKFSQVNISENDHVIIPLHLRVPEAARTQLTFGSFGAEFDSTNNVAYRFQANAEQSNGERSASVSAPSTPREDVNQADLLDGQVTTSGSGSPVSSSPSEHQLPYKNDSSPENLENYADIGLVRNDSPSYSPAEPQHQQDAAGLPSFPAYDHQTGYDMPFFRPMIDESVHVLGAPSPAEALSSHAINSIPASTMAMVQQQQMAQLYPQVHVPHFPNFMPYRQFVSPVFVPPMAMPGYSSNPAAYPHPSNANSYMLMPGGSSHLAAGGLKYGTSQYKPIPAGTPTGFGNYTNQGGYAMNHQGTVGGATGLEDSNRIKYKEGNIYVPNPQAETSELWIQTPRELPGMQSAPYYNIPGQAPHAASYMPSHTGHASFNAAAAAAAQPTHLHYSGLYHPSPQPAAIANPHHHIVPGVGSNVGVGVAAASPGTQVGAYQQPQVGHMNWNTNF